MIILSSHIFIVIVKFVTSYNILIKKYQPMYCRFCGNEISDNSNFCSHCGKSLESSNSSSIVQSIKSYVLLKKKTFKIVLITLLCALIGVIVYLQNPRVKIVGEWKQEVRMGTQIEVYKSDGTFESKVESQYYPNNFKIVGNWSISGKTLRIHFWNNGQEMYDNYEIVKLTYNDLIYRHGNTRLESHYVKIK